MFICSPSAPFVKLDHQNTSISFTECVVHLWSVQLCCTSAYEMNCYWNSTRIRLRQNVRHNNITDCVHGGGALTPVKFFDFKNFHTHLVYFLRKKLDSNFRFQNFAPNFRLEKLYHATLKIFKRNKLSDNDHVTRINRSNFTCSGYAHLGET